MLPFLQNDDREVTVTPHNWSSSGRRSGGGHRAPAIPNVAGVTRFTPNWMLSDDTYSYTDPEGIRRMRPTPLTPQQSTAVAIGTAPSNIPTTASGSVDPFFSTAADRINQATGSTRVTATRPVRPQYNYGDPEMAALGLDVDEGLRRMEYTSLPPTDAAYAGLGGVGAIADVQPVDYGFSEAVRPTPEMMARYALDASRLQEQYDQSLAQMDAMRRMASMQTQENIRDLGAQRAGQEADVLAMLGETGLAYSPVAQAVAIDEPAAMFAAEEAAQLGNWAQAREELARQALEAESGYYGGLTDLDVALAEAIARMAQQRQQEMYQTGL